MTQPIKPEEIKTHKNEIPDIIIEVFNSLIVKNYENGKSVIEQTEITELILTTKIGNSLSEKDIFINHWLDVEDIYREAGWNVKYNKPSYGGIYPATFIFTSNMIKD